MSKLDENGRKNGLLGFAETYMNRCFMESKSDEKIDIVVYKKLVELDRKQGRTDSELLFKCLLRTSRSDIIQVWIYYFDVFWKVTVMLVIVMLSPTHLVSIIRHQHRCYRLEKLGHRLWTSQGIWRIEKK